MKILAKQHSSNCIGTSSLLDRTLQFLDRTFEGITRMISCLTQYVNFSSHELCKDQMVVRINSGNITVLHHPPFVGEWFLGWDTKPSTQQQLKSLSYWLRAQSNIGHRHVPWNLRCYHVGSRHVPGNLWRYDIGPRNVPWNLRLQVCDGQHRPAFYQGTCKVNLHGSASKGSQ
jgi:hypothetical protein